MLFGKNKRTHRQNAIIVYKPGNEIITESFNRLKDNIVFQNVDNTIKVIHRKKSKKCRISYRCVCVRNGKWGKYILIYPIRHTRAKRKIFIYHIQWNNKSRRLKWKNYFSHFH